MKKEKINSVEYFKILIAKMMNEYSVQLHKEIRSIQETLAENGMTRSGTYVTQTYSAIDKHIKDIIISVIKEVSEYSNEIHINAKENTEIKEHFLEMIKPYIESIMKNREEMLSRAGLKDSGMDYKLIVLRNAIHSIEQDFQLINIKTTSITKQEIIRRRKDNIRWFVTFLISLIAIILSILTNYDKIKSIFER